MKRPLQLPLAIALALGGTHAMALGLGPVHVKSKLNQPLEAEIPVIQGTAGEAEGLLVSLAAAEDFERVGITRAHLTVPLEFTVTKGANGQPVIRVTSREPVRESYLDFLVEANWPKGRLLREYTVLLDPPVTAPVRSTPSAVAVAPAAKPVERPAPVREKPKAVAEKATPAPAVRETKPAAPTPSAPRRIVEGEYGPTQAGETLSGIARATRPGSGVSLDQMMLALLKNNPNAFYKDNINALKRGAILRVPSADEARAIGSVAEAAAQVRSQIEDWQGGRAAPTRVAAATEAPARAPAKDAAKAPAKASTASSRRSDERLELVPPKAGKDSIAMADQPGAGAGSTGNGSTEIKRELARAREALAARDQETGELKSRVKELEDLKSKNDRLITLKDSEIADLQQKLKELQEKAAAARAAPATATPAPTAATVTSPTTSTTAAPASAGKAADASSPASTATPPAAAPIDKKDIWGDAGTASAAAGEAKPAAADKPATPDAPPDATVTTPESPAASATTTTPATTTPDATASGSADATPASPGGATVTPLAPTPPTTTSPTTTPPAAKAATKPVAKPKKASPPPAPAPRPWYQAPWVMPTALGAGVLLVLAGLLGMRKRGKPAAATATRGSIADAFGDAPYSETQGTASAMDAEAAALREQIANEPGNTGLYLELLSLYYAERDVAQFEQTAAEMHAYVTDPQQPEWQEAVAMGQELAPHNPLFAEASADPYAYEAPQDPGYAETARHPVLEDDFAAPQAQDDADYGFGFDAPATPATAPSVPPPAEDTFSFDDLPPLEPTRAHQAPMEQEPAMKAEPTPKVDTPPKMEPTLDDDFFAGEDAVGTKLDLAKAYLDMGDPDGARSMLEEVVAEGNDAQKAEAQRLIAELR